ncbi:MAG: group III truncated hemoglobin [Nitrospina sp.]|nr:group III truncated hemoglobin [Nitrospina sp.]
MKPANANTPHEGNDISSQGHIRILVDSFYEKVRQDSDLAPIFEEHIRDWQTHLPIMYRFWERLLFGTGTYDGNPFAKHLPLPLEKRHFESWVRLFTHTVNEHFEGPIAEKSKQLARNIAGTFQLRMGIEPENARHAIPHYSRHHI